jgi:hypothetical protein
MVESDFNDIKYIMGRSGAVVTLGSREFKILCIGNR